MNSRWQSKSLPPLFLTSTYQHEANPIIADAMIQPVLPPRTILHVITDSALVRWIARVICIRISPFFNSSLRNRWVPFSQLFRNRRVCLIQSLCSFIRGHAICLLHQHGPWQFLSERVLLLCWFRYASFQPIWFMLISISFAVALPCQRCIRCRFRISPWSSLLRWVLNSCVGSGFSSADS